MTGLFALMVQDFTRLLKNALFWVITATLVIIITVVNYALPGSVSEEVTGVWSYNTNDGTDSAIAVSSEEALYRTVREEGGIGLLGRADGGLTVIHPGLSEKTVRAAILLLQAHDGSEVDIGRLEAAGRTIPFNQRMTPVFICFEALIVGFVLGGALMLSEKEERTSRALAVSPMGADRYLISKVLLFSVIGTAYALLMAFFCVGIHFSVLRFIVLSFFGAAVFSLIGLAFSALFRDMSSWFFTMALLLSVNMLPVVAYSEPSFSPLWLQALPSYPLIFSYERILFGKGGSDPLAALTVAAWGIAAYFLSRLSVSRYFLLKGGGHG